MSIPASTLWDGFVDVGAALRPDLLAQPVLHADETPLTILDVQKGKAKSGYLWAHAVGSEREVVVYD